jgi:hypothetical protein
VPIGLINGNIYREGTRPPFRPPAIIAALRQVIQRPRVTTGDLIDIIGPPDFPTGCTVTGDFAALAAGHPTVLRLQARVTISDDHRSVVIENLPPNANPDETASSLANRAAARDWAPRYPALHRSARLPIKDVRDLSLRAQDTEVLVCVPELGTTPEQLRDHLLDVCGVYTTVPAALPRPLATMIRKWAKAYGTEDLLTSLTALENAIRIQPVPG